MFSLTLVSSGVYIWYRYKGNGNARLASGSNCKYDMDDNTFHSCKQTDNPVTAQARTSSRRNDSGPNIHCQRLSVGRLARIEGACVLFPSFDIPCYDITADLLSCDAMGTPLQTYIGWCWSSESAEPNHNFFHRAGLPVPVLSNSITKQTCSHESYDRRDKQKRGRRVDGQGLPPPKRLRQNTKAPYQCCRTLFLHKDRLGVGCIHYLSMC